ncbi:alpha/beta hydrolase family protein [Ceratobasidium sp. AG-Ba]|nr:alpha/beta hydrolase family protein [Ceratobasidium sp. AG-Ba]
MATAIIQRPNIEPAEPVHTKGAERKDCALAMLSTRVHSIVADGMNVFYREAGMRGRPVILLLHGGIASSFQFRQLMPLLAREFHVFAPDMPGHGFTTPTAHRPEPYKYTFVSLARTITAFVNALKLTSYALYLFDFGAAVGWRLALAHPERVTAIIAQAGNAYIEGLGKAWEPVRALWGDLEAEKPGTKHEYTYKKVSGYKHEKPIPRPHLVLKPEEGDEEDAVTGTVADKLRLLRAAVLSPEGVHWVYSHGAGSHGNGRTVSPESHMFETALMLQEPVRGDIHLGLLADYRTTVRMYPLFQRYLREWAPRVLAIWGSRDAFLDPVGARMYQRDVPDAEVLVLDAGHFALETHVEEIAAAVTRHVLML